jgi:hypothetical protein
VSKRLAGKDNHGKPVYFTTRGTNLHSSLAITLEGLPLGLITVKFWSRAVEKVQWYALRWKAQQGAATLPQGRRFWTFEINLAVEGHEQLHGLQLRIPRGIGKLLMHKFVGQVFDGMGECFQCVSGLRCDAAAVGTRANIGGGRR